MKTIAVYSLKGGVGKTMTAANLAHMYATHRGRLMPGAKKGRCRRALVVDCDTQGNLSQYFQRYDRDSMCGLRSGRIQGTDWAFLDIISSSFTDLFNLEREMYETKNDITSKVADCISQANSKYDVCFIDCPPAFNMITMSAMCAADYLIVPIRLDGFSSYGLMELEDQLKDVYVVNPKLKMLGALITHDEVTKHSQEAERLLRARFPVFQTKISRSRWMTDSTLLQKPLAEMGMRLKPAFQYRKLLNEVCVRIGQLEKEET